MPSARLRACGVRRAWPCPAALSGLLPHVSGGSGGGAPAACPLRRRPRRLCFRASGPSCLRPASGGLSHGFSRIPAPCGFRRALSCPAPFVCVSCPAALSGFLPRVSGGFGGRCRQLRGRRGADPLTRCVFRGFSFP